MKTALIAFLGAMTFAAPTLADDLAANKGRMISLGDMSGSAYYTVEDRDFRVVTTVTNENLATPLRMTTYLADGEQVTLEIPAVQGQNAEKMLLERAGDHLYIHSGADLRASLN